MSKQQRTLMKSALDDWKRVSLDTLLTELLTGGRPSGGGKETGDYISLGGTQINSMGHIELIDLSYIDEEYFDTVSKTQLQRHDVLMVKDGANTGDVAIAWEDRSDIVTNEHVLTLRIEGANAPFVFYFLLSHYGWKQLKGVITGSAQEGINKSFPSKVDVFLPPLCEQRKIASVLYTVDELMRMTADEVRFTQRLLNGLRNRLVQQGMDKNSDVSAVRLGPVLAEMPVDWEQRRIGELYSDRQLGTTERGYTSHGTQVPLIKMGNVKNGTWDLSEVEYIDRTKEVKELQLQEGDLLFNTRNTPELVGKTAVWEYEEPAVYDNNLLRLRFDEQRALPRYVNHYLSSTVGRRQLRSRVHGTTSVAAIYWKDLARVEIPVPPLNVQRTIVDTLTAVGEVIEGGRDYHDQLRAVKKGLMEDLLTGEVRTKDVDIDIPEEVAAYG